jgi:hypothetical protein
MPNSYLLARDKQKILSEVLRMKTTEEKLKAAAKGIVDVVMDSIELTGSWSLAGQGIVYGYESRMGFHHSITLCGELVAVYKKHKRKDDLRARLTEATEAFLAGLLKEKQLKEKQQA